MWSLYLIFVDNRRTLYISATSLSINSNRHSKTSSPFFFKTIQKAGYQQSKVDYFLFTKAQGISFTIVHIWWHTSHRKWFSRNKTSKKNVHVFVRIEPLKVRHDVTKLDLTIHLLSFWCIEIDLSIQPMSLTLYITWVH